METPEEQLMRQAAIARSAHQQQKLRSVKGSDRQNQHAVSSEYNASIGAHEIQLADGSILYAASNSNGFIGTGDALELHQGPGIAHVDAMPAPKRKKLRLPPGEKILSGPFKVLFSLFKDGVTSFYIGGDRAVPLKILELPVESVTAYITNTGIGKDDWICGFTYIDVNGDNIIKSIGKNGHTWKIVSPTLDQCKYHGWGYWTKNFSGIINVPDIDLPVTPED